MSAPSRACPRPSHRWTVPAALTEHARQVLSDRLDACFSDENTRRPGWGFLAPDVHIVVVDEGGEFTMVAHFGQLHPGGVTTRLSWVSEQVMLAALEATGVMPGRGARVQPGH